MPEGLPATQENFRQTTAPKNKVVAATGGAAVGSAIAVILTWILSSVLQGYNIDLPTQVTSAFTAIFTSVGTFVAGYYMPPGASEGVIIAPDGSAKSATKSTAPVAGASA
jgi:hypothetical protein